jgi:hypothetical protein
MREMNLVRKSNPPSLKPVTPLSPPALDLRLELAFQRRDVVDQFINPRSHEGSSDRASARRFGRLAETGRVASKAGRPTATKERDRSFRQRRG